MKEKKIVVIDGQGGQLGAQLVKEIIVQFPDIALCNLKIHQLLTEGIVNRRIIGNADQAGAFRDIELEKQLLLSLLK